MATRTLDDIMKDVKEAVAAREEIKRNAEEKSEPFNDIIRSCIRELEQAVSASDDTAALKWLDAARFLLRNTGDDQGCLVRARDLWMALGNEVKVKEVDRIIWEKICSNIY
jgi:hypothetical protein